MPGDYRWAFAGFERQPPRRAFTDGQEVRSSIRWNCFPVLGDDLADVFVRGSAAATKGLVGDQEIRRERGSFREVFSWRW